jgi:hypothetical protein
MMPQLNIRLNANDVTEFDTYSRSLGLDRTGLANLLLRRELQIKRLSTLDSAPVKGRDSKRPRSDKITAHLPSKCLTEFSQAAAEVDLSRSAAGALILLEELNEKWLQRALSK